MRVDDSNVDKDLMYQIPGGAAGYYLLGRLCCLTDNQQEAVRCYRSALMMDPLLWCAYEGLCNLGEHNLCGPSYT